VVVSRTAQSRRREFWVGWGYEVGELSKIQKSGKRVCRLDLREAHKRRSLKTNITRDSTRTSKSIPSREKKCEEMKRTTFLTSVSNSIRFLVGEVTGRLATIVFKLL